MPDLLGQMVASANRMCGVIEHASFGENLAKVVSFDDGHSRLLLVTVNRAWRLTRNRMSYQSGLGLILDTFIETASA